MYPKLNLKVKLKVNFGGQFIYPWKTKIIVKTNISPKTKSLGLSSNITNMSQKNHRILVKLIQKKWMGGQNGHKLPPGAWPNG